MKYRNDLTVEYLKSILKYNPEIGIFTWKVLRQGTRKNKVAGYLDKEGYVIIIVDYTEYKAHRLAWLYMTGKWPEYKIDHKNFITHDNRWCNLRLAVENQNQIHARKSKNNTSGYKGVHWCNTRKKWIVRISNNKKRITLGFFDDKEKAALCYNEAAIKFHGEYAVINEVKNATD